ncbi:hypothetical protein M413DRAFT_63304 [Hebeloma cylindrosporum]|uniref:Uncharacterized protein n=1 Tax=Hebeloma cylindrosporum TaxID=76867 RepID=A0A0C2Z1L1_HEBCY|nr:hypothetical protein M413DRAFT_63304 [Hebeloma cylindrosporum h7]
MNSTNRRSLKQPKRQKEKFRFLEVERFLRACNPPMDHHLQRFIDFGCDNEEFLRGISSWAEGNRVAILKKILTRPKGESGVTEMEVAVIDNNLEAYFGDDR